MTGKGNGKHFSKKRAEQIAAEQACKAIGAIWKNYILIAGSKSLFSSIRNIRTSLTQVLNHGNCFANLCTAKTHETAVILSEPKYTLPCCHLNSLASINFRISPYAFGVEGVWYSFLRHSVSIYKTTAYILFVLRVLQHKCTKKINPMPFWKIIFLNVRKNKS